jgi:hypothetical protein
VLNIRELEPGSLVRINYEEDRSSAIVMFLEYVFYPLVQDWPKTFDLRPHKNFEKAKKEGAIIVVSYLKHGRKGHGTVSTIEGGKNLPDDFYHTRFIVTYFEEL